MEGERKQNMRGRQYFAKFRPIIMGGVKLFSIMPRRFRLVLFGAFRDKNGYSGLLIRYVLFAGLVRSCGDNVAIHQGCYFDNLQNMVVGNNVAFNQMCYVQGSGGLTIGNDVGFAHGVTIETESHGYTDLSEKIGNQPMIYKPVIIEDDVWVGAKVTILAGNTIGKGAIVGANAVVTKSVDPFWIIGGCPARFIKSRK